MKEIRNQLVKHIHGGEAFTQVDKLLEFISFEKLCERPGNLPYSFYEIFYHIRFAQKDILDYCKNDNYKSHTWPDEYWPKNNFVKTSQDWELLKSQFLKERAEFCEFIMNPENELLEPINAETDNTLLREILLVIEHNAYHTGQLLIVLRSLELYPV